MYNERGLSNIGLQDLVICVCVCVFVKLHQWTPERSERASRTMRGDMRQWRTLAMLIVGRKVNVIPSGVILFFIGITFPIFFYITYRNPMVKFVLLSGWIPIFFSIAISGATGVVLENAIERYRNLALFEPVFLGLPCVLGGVYISRMSTSLHQRAELGTMPPYDTTRCEAPWTTFCSRQHHTKLGWLILLELVISEIFFSIMITLIKGKDRFMLESPAFIPFYTICGILQMLLFLYIARTSVYWMWSWKFDPDNIAFPILGSLSSFMAICFLWLSFYLYSLIDSSIEK